MEVSLLSGLQGSEDKEQLYAWFNIQLATSVCMVTNMDNII